jgi:LAS superfamily LD-carboxypeptidase LdcB
MKKKRKRRRYRINWSALKPEIRHDKRSRRRRRITLIIIAACLLIIAAFRLPDTIAIHKLEQLGYDRETASIIVKDRLDQRVTEYGYYSDYLAEAFQKGTVNGDYLPLYLNVYQDRELTADDFLLCQRLQDAGYETDQIQNLFASLSYEEILPLLTMTYQYNEKTYIQDVEDCRETNTDGTFELNGDYTSFYTNPQTVTEVDTDTLVNKNYMLSSDFVPSDLVTLDTTYAVDGVQMVQEAADAFSQMAQDAWTDDIWFYATDGYVDYASQETIYQSYTSDYGTATADLYMARAGASEHQTGLAVDVVAANQESVAFETTDAYAWLQEHAAEYGFILRYPDGREMFTGYEGIYDHLRYVGRDLAENITSSGLTFDMYYALYLKPWNEKKYIPADDVLNSTSYDVNTAYEDAGETASAASPSAAASASPSSSAAS